MSGKSPHNMERPLFDVAQQILTEASRVGFTAEEMVALLEKGATFRDLLVLRECQPSSSLVM